MRKKVKVAVLISGNGSNLQALIDACAQDDYPAEIALVISNKADAYGLKRAEVAAIDNVHIASKNMAEFEAQLQQKLLEHEIEIVCLAGFMRLLSPEFTQKWATKMINIHPSLLPAYKGLNTHERAINAGEKIAGATVHFVISEMDAGEIILQQSVEILAGETPESLQQKVHKIEHIIYPQALKIVVNQLIERG